MMRILVGGCSPPPMVNDFLELHRCVGEKALRGGIPGER